MGSVRNAVICFFVLSLPAAGWSQDASAAKSGQGTGERIGNVVSAIVSTAFPAVDKVINAIWPDRSKKKDAKEAEDAVKTAHDRAVAAQRPHLEEIKRISADLGIVRTFLSHCVVADEEVTTMRAILGESTKVPSQDEIGKLKDAWENASARIGALGGEKITEGIGDMKDTFVQTTLRRVAEVNLGKLRAIGAQLEDSRWAALRTSLAELQPNLSAVAALSGELIGNFSSMLVDLPDKLKGAQGSSKNDREASTASEVFRNRLSKQYDIKWPTDEVKR